MDMKNLLAGQVEMAQMTVSPTIDLHRQIEQRSAEEKTRAELHKAGQEFESYFISYLIKNMRETIPKGLFDRKNEQVWYSFYDQEIAKLATQAGGIGITAFVDAYTEKNR
jgi:flagellar protein FlgJ